MEDWLELLQSRTARPACHLTSGPDPRPMMEDWRLAIRYWLFATSTPDARRCKQIEQRRREDAKSKPLMDTNLRIGHERLSETVTAAKDRKDLKEYKPIFCALCVLLRQQHQCLSVFIRR